MGMFSMSWFKTEKQKELEELQLQEQKIKNELLKTQVSKTQLENLNLITPFEASQLGTKPYKKIKLVNDVLTIILNNGDLISKSEASVKMFNHVREAETETEILDIILSKKIIKQKQEQEKENNKLENIINSFSILEKLEDFEVKEGSVYLKGINRTLPVLVVEEFIKIITVEMYYTGFGDLETSLKSNVEYNSLKKFALKCFLNPNAQSAEDLYHFLCAHQFKIDRHGNFYAYRRVVSKPTINKSLVEFVSNTYTKVKAVWKKNPDDYYVWILDDGSITFNKQFAEDGINSLQGNLKQLYLNLPKLQKNSYTSAHTGNEDYRIGEIITMPRNDGDDDNNISCSKGFHAASKEYDYSGFGDTPILVIISPADVLAVPTGEVGKLRTSAWFFACTLSEEEQHILDDEDFIVEDLGDVFEEKYQENLKNKVMNNFSEEVKRHTFTLPTINNREVNNIIRSLEEMKNEIDNRVIII